MNRGYAILSLCLLFASHRTACQDRTVTYAENLSLETFDPITYTPNPVNDRLSTLLFSQLYRLNENSVPQGDMAKEMFIDGSRKNTAIVTLRPGMKWRDGSPVTAEDVIYTIDLLKNPDTELNAVELWRNTINSIQSVAQRKQDEFSITFTVPQQGNRWERILIFPIVSKKALQGVRVLKRRDPFCGNPVGSGPYFFASAENNLVRLRRNANYHRNEPGNPRSIESVNLYSIPDDEARVSRLFSSGVDMLIEVPPEKIAKIEGQRSQFEIAPYNSLTFHYMGFNFKNELLRNRNVREAISLAINRADVIGKFYAGRGESLSGPFPRSSPYRDPDVPSDNYDPPQSRQLLATAGMSEKNKDGVLLYQGKPVRLRLVYSRESGSEGDLNNDVCLSIQGALREIGIDAQLEPVPSREKFLDRLFRNGDFDLSFHVWRFTDLWGDPTVFFHTDPLKAKYNYISYSNADVDAVIELFKKSNDPETKKSLGRRLHKILAKERPYAFLWSIESNAAYNRRKLLDVSINPFSFFDMITSWQVR